MASYAVIFRTHFWDDFTRRQLQRLRAAMCEGDIFVLVDETNGPVAGIEHDRVVRTCEAELLGMGLARAGTGGLLWFNGDYPLYRFQELHPNYDYYVQLEYDVVFKTDLDAMVARADANGIDFVGLTKGEATPDWPWVDTCDGVYPPDEIRHQLICVSLFSNRALAHLHRRRLALSEAYRFGTIRAWPMCEAFIATELARGFRCAELSEFGDTGAYDHWPPFLERDLDRTAGAFIHPLLDEQRYASSLLKYQIGLTGYLRPNSLFHRKARRLPARQYVELVASSFVAKARRTLRDVFGPSSRHAEETAR